jgi:hypothetical protein
MVRFLKSSLFAVLLGCTSTIEHPKTVAEHEWNAQYYDRTADSIEVECWKARRHELTVDYPQPCWKSEDVRFLTLNRKAAADERAKAMWLRNLQASR